MNRIFPLIATFPQHKILPSGKHLVLARKMRWNFSVGSLVSTTIMWWIAFLLLSRIPLPPTWAGDPWYLPVDMDPVLEGDEIVPEYWEIFDHTEESDDEDEEDPEDDQEASEQDPEGYDDDGDGPATVPGNIPELKILTGTACIRDLTRRGIQVTATRATRGVETPVHVFGSIGGIEWLYAWDRKGSMHIDCKFVYGLLRFAPILKAHGVKRVTYTSTYRAPGRRVTSQHGAGMAVDVRSVTLEDGRELVILHHWRKAYGNKSDCVGKITSPDARILRSIACAAEQANIFRLFLTPDSDWDHQNHFHIDGLGRLEYMRPRHAGRLADQPLPGEPAFENWWRWYTCFRQRTPAARQRCYRNRAYLKPKGYEKPRTVPKSVEKPREPRKKPAPRRRRK